MYVSCQKPQQIINKIQVFDAVADEAAKHGVYVHLDNHISKAMWCCGNDDGNAWFGDTYFNVSN
jgi:hypothetical protein